MDLISSNYLLALNELSFLTVELVTSAIFSYYFFF